MDKSKKIYYQFYKAIVQATSIGADKYSYKRSNANKVKIFSYADRRNIIKCTDQISKFIENNYCDIKSIKEINVTHINEFINYKAQFCSTSTIKNYKYCIRKLEMMVKQYLHLNVKYYEYSKGIKKGPLIRNIKMEQKDIELLLKEISKSNSKAVLGVRVAVEFGLRSEEICKLKGKDIKIETMILHVHQGKGKRSRDIKIRSETQLKLCNEIKSKTADDDRVCPIYPNSLNAAIRRVLIKNKITVYSSAKTNVHAIRKYYATKDYEENLKEIGDEKKAWDATANKLGHGDGRSSLKNVYVKGEE